GSLVLMPAVNQSVAARRAERARIAATAPPGTVRTTAPAQPHSLTRAEKAERVQVATVFAYWGVCALLVIAALFVAWLDLREISRTYLQHRRKLWTQAAETM